MYPASKLFNKISLLVGSINILIYIMHIIISMSIPYEPNTIWSDVYTNDKS